MADETTYKLVVVQPFGSYKRGDMITDSATVTKILESANARHVRKIKGE